MLPRHNLEYKLGICLKGLGDGEEGDPPDAKAILEHVILQMRSKRATHSNGDIVFIKNLLR